MYVLVASVLDGAELNFGWLARSKTCSSCGSSTVTALQNDITPKLRLESETSHRLFSAADGAARVIDAEWADALRTEGLLSGAALRDLQVTGSARRYYLLSAQHDLGPFVYEPSNRCPECGREQRGGHFPLLRRPEAPLNVAYTSDYGPFTPLVSGRLARALESERGVGFEFLGWYPDDLERARLPS
jgi:hypothetical protein